jgi:hypothetical protein
MITLHDGHPVGTDYYLLDRLYYEALSLMALTIRNRHFNLQPTISMSRNLYRYIYSNCTTKIRRRRDEELRPVVR